jgi:phenol 2-monooxygenase
LLTSKDLLDATGSSQTALRSAEDILSRYPPGVIDLIVIYPLQQRFEWADIPQSVKRLAEMRTYGTGRNQDVYDVYGVSKDEGAVSIVRPDGYVGTISPLESFQSVEAFFKRTLRET